MIILCDSTKNAHEVTVSSIYDLIRMKHIETLKCVKTASQETIFSYIIIGLRDQPALNLFIH